jgi:hypothetical protein
MDFLPKEPVFDDILYSEQMHDALSDTAKLARSIQNPPRRKFDRMVFTEAMMEAFEQIGGVRRLTLWADKNTTEFYRLLKATIPQAQLLDIQAKFQMQILPALAPSPLDDEIIDVPTEKIVHENPSDQDPGR